MVFSTSATNNAPFAFVADAIYGNPSVPYKVSLGLDAINNFNEMTGITVYPNPTSGELRVESGVLRMLRFLMFMAKTYGRT